MDGRVKGAADVAAAGGRPVPRDCNKKAADLPVQVGGGLSRGELQPKVTASCRNRSARVLPLPE